MLRRLLIDILIVSSVVTGIVVALDNAGKHLHWIK
jgi:hypothetical protein